MEEEKDAFYIVRKGDVVGIYKSLSDCQAQVGSSVSCPSVSVFKGYGLSKEAEEYLVSHGLRNAALSISAVGLQNGLFGKVVPCPFQQPPSFKGKTLGNDSPPKRSQEVIGSTSVLSKQLKLDNCDETKSISSSCEVVGSTSVLNKQLKLDNSVETKSTSSSCPSCILEFDGASKGNPGVAGAGAVLRADDGSMVCRLSEGLGIATNNFAEYRALILGLEHAVREGYKHIRVQGDSNLVCMQIQGKWKIKNQNLAGLFKEAKELTEKFGSFQIKHIAREFNSDADAQANLGCNLKEGQIQEDCKNISNLRR